MNQVQRVPLQDICAGPKCRFYDCPSAQPVSQYPPPIILCFYDKTEMRDASIVKTREVKKLFRSKKVEKYVKIEPILCFHVIYETFEWPISFGHYCKSFQSTICPREVELKATDYWCAGDSWRLASDDPLRFYLGFPYAFHPDYEVSKFTTARHEWHDGKCPSFVPYPVVEVESGLQTP